MDHILKNNGLRLSGTKISVAEDGSLQELFVLAVYEDQKEEREILVPTVSPIRLQEPPKQDAVSPMELYIRELLASVYGMDESKVEVMIQEV